MSLKKVTSLLMLLAMLIMSFTGIILFIAPPGRIANWANWEILSITKELSGQIHTSFMIVFIIATILHIYYNWKPMLSYMKNKTKQFVFFTKEMLASLTVVTFVLISTIIETPPISNFLEFGEKIKNSWEKQYGTAPYSHAELSSLASFTKKLGFDLEKSKDVLNSNNITFKEEQSLSQIAKENKVSPNFIYQVLKKNFEKDGRKIIPLTGLGKKRVEEVAVTLEISVDDFIS